MSTPPQPSPHRRSSAAAPSSPGPYSSRGQAHAHAHASTSRLHLPHPRVLPFPDLPVRPMSREHSRISGSPLPSPDVREVPAGTTSLFALGPASHGARAVDQEPARAALAAAAASTSPAASSSTAATALPRPVVASPTAASPPPAPSPLGRPRASTTLPPRARQEGFIPSANLRSVASAATVVATPVTAQPSSLPSPSEAAPAPSPALSTRPASSKKPSNPPPLSTPIAPPAPTQPLTDHLYQSLLKGTCADVRVIVRAWDAAWLLHRVVLVQAGFFHSLFLAGFSEAKHAKGKERDDGWAGEDVELTFDDPNITRAAFEICLSRLYSPFPRLHFPSALLPTPQQPLTPSLGSVPDLHPIHLSLPPLAHLSTPRLLLSLIATATYLGVQPVIREALAMVLRTVGPVTVTRYLGFATGDGIGELEWTHQDDEGARGLEQVHRPLGSKNGIVGNVHEVDGDGHDGADHARALSHRASVDSAASHSADDEVKCGGPGPSSSATTPASSVSRTLSSASGRTLRRAVADMSLSSDVGPLPHFYGFVSNKIGEACVCWLSRWGADVLVSEEALASGLGGAHTEHTPAVWAAGGIPAVFARAVLSSDTLFVKGEMERYSLARRVLDLRRHGWDEAREEGDDEGLWDEQEAELERVFAEGIFYSHMTFEDLSTIAADIDPTTSQPYAPLHVLQAAHWGAADMRARVSSHAAEAEQPELGLTQTTAEIAALAARRRAPRARVPSPPGTLSSYASFTSLASPPTSPALAGAPFVHGLHGLHGLHGAHTTHFPVPADDTHRIGAGGLVFLSAPLGDVAMPGMPELGPDDRDADDAGRKRAAVEGEATWFGAKSVGRSTAEIEALAAGDGDPAAKWSKHEPFRFSVEFWGVDKLNEKDRLYSATHFYAGSYFNVYVSTVRKKDKGLQLGIYLHRQSPKEPFPTPCTRVPVSTAAPVAAAASLNPPPLYRTLSTSPVSLGSPPVRPVSLTVADGGAHAPYLDQRKVTKAYFSISCVSALGTARIRFSSAPDSFPLSHSWGWRSSALRSEEYLSVPLAVPAPGGDDVLGWLGDAAVEGGSLRATVVVGVI